MPSTERTRTLTLSPCAAVGASSAITAVSPAAAAAYVASGVNVGPSDTRSEVPRETTTFTVRWREATVPPPSLMITVGPSSAPAAVA